MTRRLFDIKSKLLNAERLGILSSTPVQPFSRFCIKACHLNWVFQLADKIIGLIMGFSIYVMRYDDVCHVNQRNTLIYVCNFSNKNLCSCDDLIHACHLFFWLWHRMRPPHS